LLQTLGGGLGGLGIMGALGANGGLAGQLLNSSGVPSLLVGRLDDVTIVDAIEAAVRAVQFVAVQTAPHVTYDSTQAVPGMDHIAHAAAHVNTVSQAVSARVAV
jgi:hypothetical protein